MYHYVNVDLKKNLFKFMQKRCNWIELQPQHCCRPVEDSVASNCSEGSFLWAQLLPVESITDEVHMEKCSQAEIIDTPALPSCLHQQNKIFEQFSVCSCWLFLPLD